jgi:hypothetical protein
VLDLDPTPAPAPPPGWLVMLVAFEVTLVGLGGFLFLWRFL